MFCLIGEKKSLNKALLLCVCVYVSVRLCVARTNLSHSLIHPIAVLLCPWPILNFNAM